MRLPRLALLMFCLACAPAAAPAQMTDSTAVEDVELAGVRALDEAIVRAAIETRESTCASPFYAAFCALADADWAERRAYLDPAAFPRDEAAKGRFMFRVLRSFRRSWPTQEVKKQLDGSSHFAYFLQTSAEQS